MKKLRFFPKTRIGKWSARLIVLFFFLLIIMHILAITGQEGGETLFDNPILAIPGLVMFSSGIVALILGIFSIIKKGERSIVSFLTTLIGLLILIFIIGEIFVPH